MCLKSKMSTVFPDPAVVHNNGRKRTSLIGRHVLCPNSNALVYNVFIGIFISVGFFYTFSVQASPAGLQLQCSSVMTDLSRCGAGQTGGA